MGNIRAVVGIAAAATALVTACQTPVQTALPQASTTGATAVVGVVKISANDTKGKGTSKIDIELAQALECDLAHKHIAPGSPITDHFTKSTGSDGKVNFSGLPEGCYRITAVGSSNQILAPGSRHSLYVSGDRLDQSITFTFGTKTAPPKPQCEPEEISADLNLDSNGAQAQAKVVDCQPNWAVVGWDSPGDAQRIVRLFNDHWISYVTLPTDRCWKQASRDAAPRQYQKYFRPC